MLTCLPQSLCSWDFRVTGASAGPADVRFNFFTEQGGIFQGGRDYEIRKHGPFSGHWTLEHQGRLIADAQKPNAMFRSFDLRCGEWFLTVEAQSPFTRCFDIRSGGSLIGTIRPAHPFTRRAFIDGADDLPEPARLFAFWLAVLTWRRASNNSG